MGRTKTHEQFMKDFMEKNSKANNIEILGTYVNARTKIKCKCKIDGYEWEVLPSNLLRGYGCPKCSNHIQRTHEQFVKELEEINSDIEVLGQYVNALTKIKVKCKIDGYIWEVRPNDLLSGSGCSKCSGTKKKTHEEFIEDFNKKNSNAENIEILGTYVTNKTKIKCKCKIDGYEWEAIPSNLLRGNGCLKCSGGMKKTHEQFIEELEKINSNVEVLGQYVNALTKIKVKCKIDGHIWEVIPSTLLSGCGCPQCSVEKRTKTHEEFIKELEEINSDIEILGQYVNSKTPIECKCKIDGYEWETTPNILLNKKSGCPKCYGNAKLTHEEFINRMKEINNDIEILGTYVNIHTKIKVKCKIDGYIWKNTPSNLLRGQSCPKCYGHMKKTHEEFVKELEEINNDIEVLGIYVNSRTKIECRCKIDGHIWKATPNDLLNNNSGCPKCNSSKGEKRISKYLDSIDLEYETQYTYEDCKCKQVLPFDFYIPSLNILIEYDGEQHFKIVKHFGGVDDFIDRKIRDTIKTWYCKKNDIKLIRIPYWNFDRIEEILEKELTLYKECSII